MSLFTLHGVFERIYRNETPLLAYLWLPLHEFLYTTWSSLHVYTGMKRLWWLVFSLHYMRSITLHEFLKHMLAKASAGWSIACTTWVSFTLHGFFECIYRNQTPLSWLHKTHLATWTFRTCILEWNASDDWSLVLATWDQLGYMGFWSICWQKHLLDSLLLWLHEIL